MRSSEQTRSFDNIARQRSYERHQPKIHPAQRTQTVLARTLEGQVAAIRERLKTSDAVTVKLQMRDTRRFVETRLQNLSGLWEGEPRIAREEITKHLQKITPKPMLRSYVATGTWNWLGVPGPEATMVVPGARIELATPAFSGRRSTTELPRH